MTPPYYLLHAEDVLLRELEFFSRQPTDDNREALIEAAFAWRTAVEAHDAR